MQVLYVSVEEGCVSVIGWVRAEFRDREGYLTPPLALLTPTARSCNPHFSCHRDPHDLHSLGVARDQCCISAAHMRAPEPSTCPNYHLEHIKLSVEDKTHIRFLGSNPIIIINLNRSHTSSSGPTLHHVDAPPSTRTAGDLTRDGSSIESVKIHRHAMHDYA